MEKKRNGMRQVYAVSIIVFRQIRIVHFAAIFQNICQVISVTSAGVNLQPLQNAAFPHTILPHNQIDPPQFLDDQMLEAAEIFDFQ